MLCNWRLSEQLQYSEYMSVYVCVCVRMDVVLVYVWDVYVWTVRMTRRDARRAKLVLEASLLRLLWLLWDMYQDSVR